MCYLQGNLFLGSCQNCLRRVSAAEDTKPMYQSLTYDISKYFPIPQGSNHLSTCLSQWALLLYPHSSVVPFSTHTMVT